MLHRCLVWMGVLFLTACSATTDGNADAERTDTLAKRVPTLFTSSVQQARVDVDPCGLDETWVWFALSGEHSRPYNGSSQWEAYYVVANQDPRPPQTVSVGDEITISVSMPSLINRKVGQASAGQPTALALVTPLETSYDVRWFDGQTDITDNIRDVFYANWKVDSQKPMPGSMPEDDTTPPITGGIISINVSSGPGGGIRGNRGR